jgi:hypothetical protein
MKKIIIPVIITTLLLINAGVYFKSTQRKVELPNVCHYQINHYRDSEQGLLAVNAVYTLLKKSDKNGEISVEGQIDGQKISYHMNRVITFDFIREKENGLYLLEFSDVKRKADDNTPDAIFSMLHASMTTKMILKVEKVKDNAYLLTTQINPLAICISD